MISWFKDIPLSSRSTAIVLSILLFHNSYTYFEHIITIALPHSTPAHHICTMAAIMIIRSAPEQQPKHSAVNTKLSPLVLLYFSNQDNVGNVFVNTLSNENEREQYLFELFFSLVKIYSIKYAGVCVLNQ